MWCREDTRPLVTEERTASGSSRFDLRIKVIREPEGSQRLPQLLFESNPNRLSHGLFNGLANTHNLQAPLKSRFIHLARHHRKMATHECSTSAIYSPSAALTKMTSIVPKWTSYFKCKEQFFWHSPLKESKKNDVTLLFNFTLEYAIGKVN